MDLTERKQSDIDILEVKLNELINAGEFEIENGLMPEGKEKQLRMGIIQGYENILEFIEELREGIFD
jgi:hypothetical protein